MCERIGKGRRQRRGNLKQEWSLAIPLSCSSELDGRMLHWSCYTPQASFRLASFHSIRRSSAGCCERKASVSLFGCELCKLWYQLPTQEMSTCEIVACITVTGMSNCSMIELELHCKYVFGYFNWVLFTYPHKLLPTPQLGRRERRLEEKEQVDLFRLLSAG